MDTPLLDYAERQALLGPRDGVTFDAAKDTDRLNKQMQVIFAIMRDGDWHTLEEIEERTGRRSKGLFEYRLLLKGQTCTSTT